MDDVEAEWQDFLEAVVSLSLSSEWLIGLPWKGDLGPSFPPPGPSWPNSNLRILGFW